MKVYVVVTGDGSDGCEYEWHAIFSTEDKANAFINAEAPRGRLLWCSYNPQVEEWAVE